MNDIINKVKDLIQPILEKDSLELYDIECRKESSGLVLRIFVDNTTKSIKLDDCAAFSHEVSDLMEANNDLGLGEYNLEVSSPGLDRLLRSDSDFEWAKGKTLKVKFRNEQNKREVVEGKLTSFSQESVELTGAKNAKHNIPRSSIETARREMIFSEISPKGAKEVEIDE